MQKQQVKIRVTPEQARWIARNGGATRVLTQLIDKAMGNEEESIIAALGRIERAITGMTIMGIRAQQDAPTVEDDDQSALETIRKMSF